MPITLTEYEKRMLDGSEGKLKQVAMKNIVRYAEVLGAKELCEVTKATLFCGAHPYLKVVDSDDMDTIFSIMNMCSEEKLSLDRVSTGCFCQTCVEPFEPNKCSEMGIEEKDHLQNEKSKKYFLDAGVNIAGSCVPYLTGWVPLKGEHFVTSESHVVLLCNSLWGACGNSDGLEAGFWSAVCGRTPKWGYHVKENRLGTHVFNLQCKTKTPEEWDLIGYTIGKKLPNMAVPIITGDIMRPDIIRLKKCFSAMATTSDGGMCHIVGITPEADTIDMALGGKEPQAVITITDDDLKASRADICAAGTEDVQLVSLGCPHYSIQEIREVADYLCDKKISANVNFEVWTSYSIKAMADRCGYTAAIQNAGGDIYTNSCPLSHLEMNDYLLKGVTALAFDGAKQAHYTKSITSTKIYYGSKYECMDAAIAGKWGGSRE